MPLGNEYVLGRHSEEYERLRRQSLVWEPATRRVLAEVGIGRECRCLDVGCGPGEVMRLMGESAGEVVGLDSDARLGAEAVAELQRGGTARYRFVEADVHTFEPEERFDVVFARLLLIHMPDPLAILKRMIGWTKSGGTIVVQDYDLTAVKVHPVLETWPDYTRVLLGAFTERGRDPAIGSKLPSLMLEAGVNGAVQTDVAGKLTSLQAAGGMLSSVFRSLLPQALQLGLVDEAAARHVVDEIEEKSHDAAANATVCWPILGAAWART